MHAKVFSTILLCALLGCGGPESRTATVALPETPALAAPENGEIMRIVGESPEWSDYQSPSSAWSFATDVKAMNPQVRANAEDLAKAGWIVIGKERVTLSEKSRSDPRFLARTNGFIDVVPIATKEVVSVDSIKMEGDRVFCNLTWSWRANEVGSAFASEPLHARLTALQYAAVELRASKGQWSVWEISARAPGGS
ncbi:MAG TPA: hypothetical protein VNM92_04055 [Thermoanaerobaculia bacterium]|nr:hypothetical protein [Thermoanaerobaculia bacterium]